MAADGTLDPIAPDKLGIARLAPRLRQVEGESRAAPGRSSVGRVSVLLHRSRLPVDDDAMHFRLKMALLRGLRRRFRYSLVEVDDCDSGAEQDMDVDFLVTVEPAAELPAEQARAVVARVLRRRKWREAPPGDEQGWPA